MEAGIPAGATLDGGKMIVFRLVRGSESFRWVFVLVLLTLPQLARAQWHAAVGAQSKSKGHQALAFLPNEIWIHAGESITWTFEADEIHTVTFLKNGQVRLPFQAGCPGFSNDPSATFDGSACVSTPPLVDGQNFTVTFPAAGNYKLVCLVHPSMTGAVHVLDLSMPLPHGQGFYVDLADQERHALLSDDDPGHRHNEDHMHAAHNTVTTGVGEIVANGGGSQTLSVMRFMDETKVIHAGETIEWTNLDAVTPHTITFGLEPVNPVPPVNVIKDADGALHGTIDSTADSVHSGFIGAAPQGEMFLAEPPLNVTRFRVTFTHPGVFPYICALHDVLGMKGKVIVLP
jgi:plastocyanin